MGLIIIDEPNRRETFTSREIDLIEGMASQATVAIERAGLFEAERRVSAILQEALLTMPEEIPGLALGHTYSSATIETADVGGDFYDVFELEHNNVGIIIGDVAGKGVEAATLTALVKNTVRAYAHQNNSVGETMSLTNDTLLKRIDEATFVTIFFGVLNVDTGSLAYCNAGHPPPMVKAGNSVRPLKNHAPAIGVIENLEYKDSEIKLKKDAILVLYTDGLIEARRGKEFLGQERLEDLLCSLETSEAQEIVENIYRLLIDFTDGNLRDDVAILSISLKQA